MKIKLLLSTSLLALCGIANAQMATEITDPAKIAEIERHAQQLGAQPMAQMGGEKMDHRERMHRKHMHRKMMHHKKMDGMKPAADMAATPPAPAQN